MATEDYMTVEEIVEDLRVQLKLIKSIEKRMQKHKNSIKKVEEFNEFTKELIKVVNARELIEISIWILSQ